MSIYKLERRVWKWAEDRDLYNKSSKSTRLDKAFEELSEFEAEVLFGGNIEDIRLEAGDVIVTMINNIKPFGLTLEECLSAAYEKIKNRTGVMKNGTFVRDDKK